MKERERKERQMNQIIKEARELYRNTKKDEHLELSHIWNKDSSNHSILLNIIFNAPTPEEVITELLKTDLYAITISNTRIFRLMEEWHRRVLAIDGEEQAITPNQYKMFHYALTINRHVPRTDIVLELGGGYGQFAALSRGILKTKTHIDIDIPESLFMAYVATRAKYPEAKCLWITGPISQIELEKCDFIFCPTIHAEFFWGMSFDLFVNTASMGEMSNSTIRYWMDLIQNKINVRYFYGMNRFLNTVKNDGLYIQSSSRTNENLASISFDGNWKVLSWELEPLINRCPWEDTRIARYLEILLERIPYGDSCQETIEDIKLQDWWRLRTKDSCGTMLNNQLSHDLTKQGTLFQLWNYIRLNPSQGLIDMMLYYLKNLRKESVIFEEEFFYLELRRTLITGGIR